jgi:pyruvate kinase
MCVRPLSLQVAEQQGRSIALMLDTKGPEVRTAMLRAGKDIELIAGQSITICAVGDQYTDWEGQCLVDGACALQ